MSINTGLESQTRFVSEKQERITTNEISSIMVQCFFKCGVAFFFQLIIFMAPSYLLEP